MKNIKLFFLAMLVLVMPFIAGCSLTASNKNADGKQLLLDALKKQQEMESMAFEGEYSLNIEFDTEDPDLLAVSSFLENVKISYKGVIDQDKAELLLEAHLNLEGFRTSIEIPIIVEEEKVMVKIPALMGFIPDEFAGKYVAIDLNEMAELSGEESLSEEEEEAVLTLAQDILSVFLNSFDDSFFTVSDKNSIITLDISGDNIYDVIEQFVKSGLPEFYELLSQSSYLELLGLSAFDLEELEYIIDEIPEDISEEIAEIKEFLQVDKGEMVVELNKDGFISKQDFVLDFTLIDPIYTESITISLSSNTTYSKINQAQEFSMEVFDEDVADLMEIIESFMMLAFGFDDFYDFEDFDFDYDFDFDEDFDFDFDFDDLDWEEFERIFDLQMQLYEEEWFYTPGIEDLFFMNDELLDLLNDEAFLEMLIYDESGRKEWFSQFGIEL